MDASQVLEFVNRCLALGDPEFMLQLAGGSDTDTKLVFLNLLGLKVIQWMGATSVGPHIREGNFLGSSLLEQELPVGGSEDKGRECSMKQALVNVFHQVAYTKQHEVNDCRNEGVDLQVFLSTAPMALSFSSTKIHLSSISLDCSGS